MFSSEDIIDLAVKIEQNGEVVFRRAIEMVENEALVSLLSWIADEEQRHIEWFEGLRKGLSKKKSKWDDPALEEMGRELLLDSLGNKNFALKEADFSSVHTVKELLRIAIEFEKDTVLFYELMKEFVEEPDTLMILDQIISEENRHATLLEEFAEGSELN